MSDRVNIEGKQGAAKLKAIRDQCDITDAGCWVWQRAVNVKGLPVRSSAGRQVLVHRESYMIAKGMRDRDVRGKTITQTCGIAACVRPDHLAIGSYAQNARRTGEAPSESQLREAAERVRAGDAIGRVARDLALPFWRVQQDPGVKRAVREKAEAKLTKAQRLSRAIQAREERDRELGIIA